MKPIFIHVGPAKSGSSAIQNFCNTHQDFLSELRVMYPTHTLMESGVSAGNRNALYRIRKAGKATLSQRKIKSLIADFEQSNAKVLLLSSENFFGPMEELAKAIPQATFIFYLRNPLSLLESLYNQDVKTLSKTEPFEINTPKPNFGTIGHLQDFIKNHGRDKVIIRFFHPDFFHQGNIINDIFQAMGLPRNEKIEYPQVNPSYTLEALETKRFINHFITDDYTDYLLNNTLQQHRDGVKSYSFLEPSDYKKRLNQVIEKLEDFFEEIPCENSNNYLKVLASTEQKEYFLQHLSDEKFTEVRNYIFEANTALYFQLCENILEKHTEDKNLKSRIDLFTLRLSTSRVVRLFYRLQFQAEKAAFINKLRAKKYLS